MASHLRCPTTADLPPPRNGVGGWPWTTGPTPLPDRMPDGQPWPLISIVTPSFNQAQFIEHAIRSVLLQGYPRLELIVADGGSTDGSAETIARYAPWITHWVSEPDAGPADALNKGFAAASGEIYGFLNADDFLLEGSLEKVAMAFHAQPAADVISGHGYFANTSGELGVRVYSDRWHLDRFLHGTCVLFQPATFFRRSWFDKARGFKTSRSTWDMELWADMAAAGATFHTLDEHLAAFRLHSESITGAAVSRQDRVQDAEAIRNHLRGRPASGLERFRGLGYRAQRFARHPLRALRQRLYFYVTLGRWSL